MRERLNNSLNRNPLLLMLPTCNLFA